MLGLYEVENQLVAPCTDGQTRLPSSVGSEFGLRIGRPLASRPLAPGQLVHEWLPEQKLAIGTVEDVEESVAIGLDE